MLNKTFTFVLCTAVILLAVFSGKAEKATKQGQNRAPLWKSTTAQSLTMWSAVLENPDKFTAHQLISFLDAHTHWPQYKKLCANAEKVIAKKASPKQILVWFDSHPPQTVQGAMAYGVLLPTPQAKEFVASTWQTMKMTAQEEKQFLLKFLSLLSQKGHAARLNDLLWNENIEAAKRLFPYVSQETKKIAQLRISFLQGQAPKDLRAAKDEGLLYEMVKNHKVQKNWHTAAKILITTPSSRPYSAQWWKMRSYIARELIQIKRFDKAYLVVKKHNLEPGTKEYAEAQWLLGWLSLRFLNKPAEAQRHFELLEKNVKAAVSISRAAYWLARSCEAQKKIKMAKKWYAKSACYKTTFYGQLSAHKLHQRSHPILCSAPRATSEEKKKFYESDLVKAAHLLKSRGAHTESDLIKVLTCIASQTKTRAERELVVELTHTLSPHTAVWIARKAGTHDPVLLKIAYPLCKLPPRDDLPEKALLHAIAHRESDFNPKAVSPKNAMGLLQLISSTAAQTAKQLNVHHNDAKLFDPSHNLLLGSVHVSTLLKQYNNAYILTTAAYNAGPTPVGRWCKDFGKPHAEKIDIVDWIELIPYAETRNYVQNVLATLNVYRGHSGRSQKTLVDDLKQR